MGRSCPSAPTPCQARLPGQYFPGGTEDDVTAMTPWASFSILTGLERGADHPPCFGIKTRLTIFGNSKAWGGLSIAAPACVSPELAWQSGAPGVDVPSFLLIHLDREHCPGPSPSTVEARLARCFPHNPAG